MDYDIVEFHGRKIIKLESIILDELLDQLFVSEPSFFNSDLKISREFDDSGIEGFKGGEKLYVQIKNYQVERLIFWDGYGDSTEVPECIFNLIKLKKLEIMIYKSQYINGNYQFKSISEIPEGIGKLKKLEYLDVSFNWDLTSLPDEVWGLKNLRFLDIDATKISIIPKLALNLKNLEALWCMHEIELTYVHIWRSLPKLKYINAGMFDIFRKRYNINDKS